MGSRRSRRASSWAWAGSVIEAGSLSVVRGPLSVVKATDHGQLTTDRAHVVPRYTSRAPETRSYVMPAYPKLQSHLRQQLDQLRDAGLYKPERVLTSPQQPHVSVAGPASPSGTLASGADGAVNRTDVLNLCANNYLGLANHPEVVRAAQEAMDRWGYGMASVRFICGTQ